MQARKTFGPVVLLGLVASGFAAVAGHRAMRVVPEDLLESTGSISCQGQEESAIEFPLAGALALVALAAWGVLLVTRGVVRRGAALIAAVAAIGIVAVLLVGGVIQDDDAAADLATRLGLGGATVAVDRSAWFWVALGTALLATVAAAAAVAFVSSWPEMGSRYDAPGGSPAPSENIAKAPEEQSNLDLWKSLDEGTDPTDRPAP